MFSLGTLGDFSLPSPRLLIQSCYSSRLIVSQLEIWGCSNIWLIAGREKGSIYVFPENINGKLTSQSRLDFEFCLPKTFLAPITTVSPKHPKIINTGARSDRKQSNTAIFDLELHSLYFLFVIVFISVFVMDKLFPTLQPVFSQSKRRHVLVIFMANILTSYLP